MVCNYDIKSILEGNELFQIFLTSIIISIFFAVIQNKSSHSPLLLKFWLQKADRCQELILEPFRKYFHSLLC